MLRIFSHFFKFFYLFPHKHLQIYTIPKNPRFSLQVRKFALLREDAFFRNAMKKQNTAFTFNFSPFTLYSSCLGVLVAKTQSIKNNKLCKTNPICLNTK